MNSKVLLLLSIKSLIVVSCLNDKLNVYPRIPGLDESPHYKVSVKHTTSNVWLEPFNFLTECTDNKMCNTTGMGELLDGWTNTYVNFEMQEGQSLDVKITKLTGDPILKAVVHPKKSAMDCIVKNGEAIITINKPVLFTVDINGQMDDQDTGHIPNTNHYYDGPPIHTVTVFANPFIAKPDPEAESVLTASPGELPPSEGSWTTLYFLPGIHDIGRGFKVHANKSYYIPGDTIIYGTFSNDDDHDGHNIHLYGHGTISGDKIPHPHFSDAPEEELFTFSPIHIKGCQECIVEGVTIANSAYHSTHVISKYDPEVTPTYIKWVKVFTWKANGDGIPPHNNGIVEDCFIRTSDDGSYVAGLAIRRTVYWQDGNGSSFKMNHLGQDVLNSHPIIIEDNTVVYARNRFDPGTGNLFIMKGQGEGAGGWTVIFRNIEVEDPRPTHQAFKIMMEKVPEYSHGGYERRGPGDLYGIIFQNITVAAKSVTGQPEIIWGIPEGIIFGLTFDNVVIAGEKVESIDYFVHNEYVFN